jgi:ankyrin repeat protein
MKPDPEPGARPLCYAALCGFLELVEHLSLKYPQYASARGGICGTALHAASFKGHLQVVRYLLRHGIDVNVRVSGHDTPLLLASWKGHHDVLQCLLEHGADVELRDKDHLTPLILAAYEGHVDTVRILLEHNADANSQDNTGQTPLHNLVMKEGFKADRPQIARLLLKHGANPNARDHDLQTPLHLVSKRPILLDVLCVLLEHGADLDVEDKGGKTPLQLSLDRGHDEVTRLLSGYSSKLKSGCV